MADKSKDTGTGGINIGDNVVTMDVGVSDVDAEALKAKPTPYSPGDIAVDKDVKDISKPTRETFAKYLSKATLGTVGSSTHENTYPIGSGDQTAVESISLKDSNGFPTRPGPQNNEAKFATDFNQAISSNNPAGIKKGLTAGAGQDGNTLLPSARKSDGTLNEPIKTYTDNAVGSNLQNYNSANVVISDGALGLSPSNERNDLKYIPPEASSTTDGGTSTNILGADALAVPDYTLTLIDRATQASVIAGKNFFKIDAPELVKINNVDTLTTKKIVNENPLSATDSQNAPFNSSFFTKEIQEINNVEKVVSKLRSSYTDALISAASVDTNKFIIKRGKTEKEGGIDGNALLSTVAPEANGVATLSKPATTYTDEVLKPNLRDYADYTADKKTANLSGDAQQQNLYDLQKTTDLATDGGTSKNVLDPTKKVPFTTEAELVNTLTKANFFPVDSPVLLPVPDVKILNLFNLDSSAVLATTANATSFADVKIGSNVVVGSKGKLINKSGNDNLPLPDGNTLLPAAVSPAAASGGPYVKFVAIDINNQSQNLLGLQNPIRNYTVDTLSKNLYKPTDSDDKAIVDQQGSTGPDFFGPKQLHKPASGPSDAGTFDNIQSDPSKRAVTKEILFARSVAEVKGENAPGGVGNVYKPTPVLPNELFNFTVDGYPRSVTADQNVGASDDQYVLPVTDQVQLQSSYTEFATQDNLQIKRGKSPVDAPDGNTLLKDAAPPVAPGGPYVKPAANVSQPIGTYVSKVLQKNRYNPTGRNQFVPSDTPGAESPFSIGGQDAAPGGQRLENISDATSSDISFVERTRLYAPSQLKFGESPQNTTIRGELTPEAGFTFRRLTRLGTILQLRAAGEGEFITGNDDDDPRSNVSQLAAALLPGLGQAGAGIPLSRELLNVTEIIKNLPDESTGVAGVNTRDQYVGELIDISRNFEGTVNTALEKFSGFSSLGLLILAIVLVAVILVFFALVIGNIAAASDSLNKLRSQGTPGIPKTNTNGIAGLGSFQGRPIGGGTNLIADLIQAISTGSGATALFGIVPAYNREYSDAVYRGALAFFGLGAAIPPLLSYPGQVIVTSRAIVRGVAQLVLAFADIVTAFASGNIFSAIFKLLDIIGIIRNSRVIKALNTFTQIGDRRPYTVISSTTYKKEEPPLPPPTPSNTSTNNNVTQANIGTTGLFGSKELYQRDNALDAGLKISEIDSVLDSDNQHKSFKSPTGDLTSITSDYIGISQVKSRLQNSRALAWSSYRSPSLFVDASTTTLNLDGKPSYNKRTDTPNKSFIDASGPRIAPETVKSFEEMLDGEYMPFYFQDLRTNEIISFHAFLLSLSDDYSASYEAITGIGRAEPIRIYKDTQRKIGLSFVLAALDDNDFEHMWEKVNRLTMLVYPQYTRGKTYSNPSGITFEKPFTQQVFASPMIRLRLGNLLRSNYSKFNLARLFGLDSGAAVLPASGSNPTPPIEIKSAAASPAVAAAATEAAGKFNANPTNKFFADGTYKISVSAKIKKTTTLAPEDADRVGAPKPPPAAAPPQPKPPQPAPNPPPGDPRYVADGDWYEVWPTDKDGFLRFKIVENGLFPANDPVNLEYVLGTFIVAPGAKDADKKALPSPAGKTYYVPVSELQPDEPTSKKIEARKKEQIDKAVGVAVAAAAAIENAVTNFMNSANNAIVRSFESTSGKGLSGFIDSLAFDWYDRVTWDISLERKAPKMCKITISFTPIHDIAPGLSAQGHNRAPIYPVGPYAFGNRKAPGSP